MTMQIKTIKNRLDNAEAFDQEVNAAIAKGWKLTKREVLLMKSQPNADGVYHHTMLYAELVKDYKPEPSNGIPWQQAMLAIRQMCNSHHHCAACPAYAVCGPAAPYAWKMGAMKEAET